MLKSCMLNKHYAKRKWYATNPGILKQKNKLKSYSQKFAEIEQFKKIETQKNILHECWDMLKKTEKITEKLSIMKMIRDVSDEFPKTI